MTGSAEKEGPLPQPKPSLTEIVQKNTASQTESNLPGNVRNTKGVILRLPPHMHQALRQLALDEGTSLQALGIEALEQLLKVRHRDNTAT